MMHHKMGEIVWMIRAQPEAEQSNEGEQQQKILRRRRRGKKMEQNSFHYRKSLQVYGNVSFGKYDADDDDASMQAH